MFVKGHKNLSAGRPTGSYKKPTFDVRDCINKYFPGSKINLERKIEALGVAKASRGKELLKTYLSGARLPAQQAITAQCCDCMGYYADGKIDCECPLCPLYPYMPYRLKDQRTAAHISAC